MAKIQLTEAVKAAEALRDKALHSKLDFSKDIHVIADWSVTEELLDDLEKQQVAFPADLAEQIVKQQQQVEECEKARLALDPLKRFSQARQEWNEAHELENQYQQDLGNMNSQILDLQKALNEAEKLKTEVEQALKAARNNQTTRETLQKELENRLKRFKQIEGKPTCDYCGQELTNEHTETERVRLEGELAEAKQKTSEAKKHCTALEKEEQVRGASFETLVKELEQAKFKQQKIQHDLDTIQCTKERAEKTGSEALDQLPEQYLVNFTHGAGIVPCFGLLYPQPVVLEGLEQQKNSYSNEKRKLGKLLEQEREHGQLTSKFKETQQKIAQYQKQYPANRRQEVLKANQEAESQGTQAVKDLENLQPQLNAIIEEQRKLKDTWNKAEEARQKASEATRIELARQEEIHISIKQQQDALDTDWQSQLANLTDSQVATWQAEFNNLADALTRLEKLDKARYGLGALRQRLEELQIQLEAIPSEEKLTVQEVELQRSKAQERWDASKTKREICEEQLRSILSSNNHRKELENKRREAAHQAELHKKLAELLGPDYLQRYLLDQAEEGIVTNANQILDNLSSGTIQLNRVGRSLDLKANIRDRDKIKTLGVAYLSGSQKFRVAVSLALGMGRYASRTGRLGESVIIDEGFGSLDKEGRQEMIDVLHDLKDMLSRIILVSHQEEFFESFDQGYEIRLEEGSSIAKRR